MGIRVMKMLLCPLLMGVEKSMSNIIVLLKAVLIMAEIIDLYMYVCC